MEEKTKKYEKEVTVSLRAGFSSLNKRFKNEKEVESR